MSKIKLFWLNGGKETTIWMLLLSIILYLVNFSFYAGKLMKRIEDTESRAGRIENIEKDITEIKTEIKFIKEILQQKYK